MTVTVRTLAGPGLGAMNGFDTLTPVVPKNATREPYRRRKGLSYTLPPFSFVVPAQGLINVNLHRVSIQGKMCSPHVYKDDH